MKKYRLADDVLYDSAKLQYLSTILPAMKEKVRVRSQACQSLAGGNMNLLPRFH